MSLGPAAILAAAWLGLALSASGQAASGVLPPDRAPSALPDALPAEARLIAVGAALTDTVCALGCGGRLIATDNGGRELPETAHLPSVGYARTLSAEGLLALAPDALLGRPERGEELVVELQRELAGLRAALARREGPPPRVLFVYARSATSLHAAGRGTPGEAMLHLAGATNALADVEGYTLLSPEAAVSAAPEALVVPARSLEVMGGLEALAAHPGLSQTPAVREGRIVALDELLLLGFGPATGRAARLLAARLDPELAVADPAGDRPAAPAGSPGAR